MASNYCSKHRETYPTWFLCLQCAVEEDHPCMRCARPPDQCACMRSVRRPTWSEAVSFGALASKSAESFFERNATFKRQRRE